MSKVIIVTGANKGIGYNIVIELLRTTTVPLIIYLTARQPALGERALESINALGLGERTGSVVRFHQLDIAATQSVLDLYTFIRDTHGLFHVLINNAGIGTPREDSFADQFRKCFECNYFGTAQVTDALLPLLDPREGRIVMVSSQALPSSKIANEQLRWGLKRPTVSAEELDNLADQLVLDAQKPGQPADFEQRKLPTHAYGLSKAFMSALAVVYASEHKGLLINACSPGWVKTDVAPDGPGTAEEGAVCPTFVAIGDIGGVTGKYFNKDKEIIDW
ncbi:NAD(P)-binding protein [Calocera cornea HHB12733]|uniref:NAD(P)-binding protein n=1 Tax=Calocera cornea HHB12733 TaxID=1353952 RepID=A0A165F2S6_9BASI|nr:NAD(P)-binding protein [Calocera cornea HHB12733]